MTVFQTQTAARAAEWSIRLVAYAGGVSSTVVGSWVSSRIHLYHDSRKAHLEEIKAKVLEPLRDGLATHFKPLVGNLRPAVFVEMGAATTFDDRAKATEEQTERGDVLLGSFPAGPVFRSLDPALLEDAKKNHFPDLMSAVEVFADHCAGFVGACHAWTNRMAKDILTRSGLHPFEPTAVPQRRPYAMQLRLAAFVYKRLFRLHAPALQPRTMVGDALVSLDGDGSVALGTKDEMDALLRVIDEMLDTEQPTAAKLQPVLFDLQREYHEVVRKVDFAIASRRLRNRCDLVAFF